MMASQYGLPTGPPVYPQRPGEQDCRDYLRTGRCKYGESCKYNHPPGVQSGGGMKAPDGGFPIRPNEPACQYYLKHGTCKFGQTCKFHHPPHVLPSGGGGGGGGGGPILPAGAVLMNVGGLPGQHVIAINDGSGMHGDRVQHSHQVVQLLPQRPGEPDCIYFLRNGRCKYGATCKYHHPLTNAAATTSQSHSHHLHQQQQHHHQHHGHHQTRPQHQQQELTYAQRIGGRGRSPSTGSMHDGYGGGGGTYAQRAQVQVDQPTHFLVSDGSFQAVTLRSTHPTEASSSLASSYETATSSLQNYRGGGGYSGQDGVAVDSNGQVWRRDNNISRDHLPSYGGQRRSSSQEQLHSMGHRALSHEHIRGAPSSDGGPGLPRHESHGSFVSARMSNVPPSPGESSGMGSQSPSMSSLQRAAAASSAGGGGYYPSPAAMESDRSWASSGAGQQDYGMPRTGSGAYLSSSQFVLEEDEQDSSSAMRRHAGNGHQTYENGSSRKSGGDDQGDGLSSMTSALLSMLDTTDRDASGRETYSQSSHSKSSPEMTPRPDPRSPQHGLGDDSSSRSGERGTPSPHGTPHHQQRLRYPTGRSSMPTHMEDYEPSFLSGSHHSEEDEDGGPPTPRAGVSSRDQAYAPAWNGGRNLERNAQSVSMLQSTPSNPPPPPPGGFYLP